MYATVEIHHTQLQKSDSYRAVRVTPLGFITGKFDWAVQSS